MKRLGRFEEKGFRVVTYRPYTHKPGDRRRIMIYAKGVKGQVTNIRYTRDRAKIESAYRTARARQMRREGLVEPRVKRKPPVRRLNVFNLRVNCTIVELKKPRPATAFTFDLHFPAFRTTRTAEDITADHGLFRPIVEQAVNQMHAEHGLHRKIEPSFEIDSVGIEGEAGEEDYAETATDAYTFVMYYPADGGEYYMRKGEWTHGT